MSRLAESFWLSRTMLLSSSSPTLKRTIASELPGLDVEYTYSTPGTSQSNFSIGTCNTLLDLTSR